MKLITKLIGIMILAVLIGCAGHLFQKQLPFTIQKSIMNETAMHYNIELITKEENPLKPIRVYFKTYRSENIEVQKNKMKIKIVKNNLPQDIIMDSDSQKEYGNQMPQKKSFKLKENEMVVEYLINGETRYYKVNPVFLKID